MRKLVVALAASIVLVSACSGDSDSDTTSGTEPAGADDSVAATSSTVPRPTRAPLPKPEVKIPAALPTELKITDLTPGTGDAAVEGDTVVVYYVGVRSRDGKEFDNNFDSGAPFEVTLGANSVIQGWEKGLVGAKAGGRRQLDIPGSLAYGEQSQGDIIGPNEALTFVIDVVAVLRASTAADEPVLVIKPTKATEVVIDELVPGTGATVKDGQIVTFDYIFYRGDTGEKLTSSWGAQRATIELFKDGNIDCLIDGLIGMKVGGRRQVTCPGTTIFGGLGEESLGLPAGADLVMVADLVAAY